MATLSDLGKEYAEFIRLNSENPNVVTEIIRRIGELKYTKSKIPISDEDKKKLVDAIEKALSSRRVTKDGHILFEAEDSSELLKLVTLIRQSTQKGK